jgi:5-methylcytosine-specific restriction endonuclease McrA
MARDNFTRNQRELALQINALFTSQKWGGDLSGPGPHYECEVCHFVSNNRGHFQVDHIHPCARGGTRNRWTQEQFARALAGDIELIYELGINHMVLCFACNQAKKAKQFVPSGRGYAYEMHQYDLNPDHIYGGPPKVTDFEKLMDPGS